MFLILLLYQDLNYSSVILNLLKDLKILQVIVMQMLYLEIDQLFLTFVFRAFWPLNLLLLV